MLTKKNVLKLLSLIMLCLGSVLLSTGAHAGVKVTKFDDIRCTGGFYLPIGRGQKPSGTTTFTAEIKPSGYNGGNAFEIAKNCIGMIKGVAAKKNPKFAFKPESVRYSAYDNETGANVKVWLLRDRGNQSTCFETGSSIGRPEFKDEVQFDLTYSNSCR